MSKEVARVEVGYHQESVQVYTTEAPNAEARFAMVLIQEWGMVMAKPDGEDSSGRAKLARMSKEEVISHAFEVADAAFAEARKRGWMIELPVPRTPKEVQAEQDAADEEKRVARLEEQKRARALTS
jgi:hypothetical protein